VGTSLLYFDDGHLHSTVYDANQWNRTVQCESIYLLKSVWVLRF